MDLQNNTQLANKISDLIFENAGGDSISEAIANIEYNGVIHQVHISIVTDEIDFIDNSDTPSYRMSDGDLVRIKN